MKHQGKWALVTGASSGLGKGFAVALAQEKYNLVLVSRSEAKLKAIAQDLETRFKIQVRVQATDLSKPEETHQLLSTLQSEDFDLVINNAGAGVLKEFSESTSDEIGGMLNLNMNSLALIAHSFASQWKEKKSQGIILNVASTAAFQSVPGMAAYAATKAFVLSLSEACDYELKSHGIRMLALCPGPTRTEFFAADAFDLSKLEKFLQTVEEVVEVGMNQIRNGTGVQISGTANRVGTFMLRFSPRPLVTQLAARLFKNHSK